MYSDQRYLSTAGAGLVQLCLRLRSRGPAAATSSGQTVKQVTDVHCLSTREDWTLAVFVKVQAYC